MTNDKCHFLSSFFRNYFLTVDCNFNSYLNHYKTYMNKMCIYILFSSNVHLHNVIDKMNKMIIECYYN